MNWLSWGDSNRASTQIEFDAFSLDLNLGSVLTKIEKISQPVNSTIVLVGLELNVFLSSTVIDSSTADVGTKVTLTSQECNLASSSVTVRIKNAVGALRTFSTPEWAFLLGPQTVPGTYSAVGVPNLEASLTARIDEFVTRNTSVPGFALASGTISLTSGSSACVGVGTDFTGRTNAGIKWADATKPRGFDYARIVSVSSPTDCVIGGYSSSSGSYIPVNFAGSSISNVEFYLSNNTLDYNGTPPDQFNSLYNYYDTVLALYQAWAKVDNMSSSSTILTRVRLMADHLADTQSLGGFVTNAPQPIVATPRGVGLVGHICRAYDGGFTECFTAFDRYVEQQSSWLDREMLGKSFGNLNYVYSVRDGAYILMFAAILGVVHPNATRRIYFRDKAIAWALDPCIRKYNLSENGGLRWWNRKGDVATFAEADGVTPADYHQPFLHSLMHEAFVWVHRMMRYHGMTADPNYTSIGNAIVAAANGWFSGYQWSGNGQPASIRGLAYFTGNLGQLAWGTTPLVVVTPPGTPFALLQSSTAWDKVAESRQLNADGLANVAYAYAISGDITHKNMCLEALASCFEFQAIPWTSTSSSLWYLGQTEKNWNQHHRTGQKLTGWLYAGLDNF